VAEPSSAGGSSGHVRLDGEALFANVRTESAFVPARITGEVDGLSLGAGTALAVTVNGRVEATTRTFRLDGRTRFAVVVGEGSFLEGANSVSVFSVAKRRSGLRLAYLGGTASASPYRLAADETGIVLPGRRLARLSKGELDGALEAPIVEGGTVRIRGWAADLRHRSLVDRVLIFSGTELVYSAATTVFRWDLGSVPSTAGSARVGFVAELPAGAIRGGQVRVFAVRGRTASELEVPRSTERLVASTERG
jgi:hypothetical protein